MGVACAGVERESGQLACHAARAARFRLEGVLRNAAWSRAGRGDMAGYALIPNDLEAS